MAQTPRTDKLHHHLLPASSCSPGYIADSRSTQLPVGEPTSRHSSTGFRRQIKAKSVRGSPARAEFWHRGTWRMGTVQQLREADRRYPRSVPDDAREGPQVSPQGERNGLISDEINAYKHDASGRAAGRKVRLPETVGAFEEILNLLKANELKLARIYH
jgi:hypothetical protein